VNKTSEITKAGATYHRAGYARSYKDVVRLAGGSAPATCAAHGKVDLRLAAAAYYVGEQVIEARGLHYANPDVVGYVASRERDETTMKLARDAAESTTCLILLSLGFWNKRDMENGDMMHSVSRSWQFFCRFAQKCRLMRFRNWCSPRVGSTRAEARVLNNPFSRP
jgi:hypothetical protein